VTTLREALLQGRRRPRTAGAGSPTVYRGDGYEFVELREYVPGDDVRRIDWAASARSGELQTRVVLEDVALTLAVIVDTSASMQAGRTRALADAAQDAVRRWFAAATGEDRCLRVFGEELLPGWDDRSETSFDLERSLRVAHAALRRGTALLVIGDFYDLPASDDDLIALGRRFDCTALIARDPWQEDLPLSGFVRVRDAENGSAAALYLGRAERRRYAAASRAREESLIERLELANWRTGILEEDDGERALLRAFGLR
jgi:uncharacterized protein (DUF58 family)